MPVAVVCKICGKEFDVKPSHLKNGWGKYCSIRCKNEGQKIGKFVNCSYCGKKVYRSLSTLSRKSKTKIYFCNKSCHCAWKNKNRSCKRKSKLLKDLWRSWCNSSIRICGILGTDANSVDLPTSFLFSSKKNKSVPLKRPSKKTLYNFYWKKNKSQTEIAEFFNATHTSVKRWLDYYKIPVKSRALSCGRSLSSRKNLILGRTKEAIRKSAESRRIYSKEKLIRIIHDFVEKEGRIPTKNEFAKNSSYPDHVTYREYFGTWNNAIKVAGYMPNKRWFAPRNLKAKDGHLCHSISEIIIDDWLFKNNIPHDREGPYPEGKYRFDFIIRGIFIEFFGLADAFDIASHYTEIMDEKRKICKKYRIPLVELYEKDLYNLDNVLGEKFMSKQDKHKRKVKRQAKFTIFDAIRDNKGKGIKATDLIKILKKIT